MDYGIQLGRRFRALKLWMVLRYFGHEGLANRIREHCRLARLFATWVRDKSDWEVLAPVPFSLVCFRACPLVEGENETDRASRLDALNENIMNSINATGEAYLSHTRLNNKLALRLAIGNIRTSEVHIKKIWALLNEKKTELE
jgi:aromatic-L-amino-acid decarboxylase